MKYVFVFLFVLNIVAFLFNHFFSYDALAFSRLNFFVPIQNVKFKGSDLGTIYNVRIQEDNILLLEMDRKIPFKASSSQKFVTKKIPLEKLNIITLDGVEYPGKESVDLLLNSIGTTVLVEYVFEPNLLSSDDIYQIKFIELKNE